VQCGIFTRTNRTPFADITRKTSNSGRINAFRSAWTNLTGRRNTGKLVQVNRGVLVANEPKWTNNGLTSATRAKVRIHARLRHCGECWAIVARRAAERTARNGWTIVSCRTCRLKRAAERTEESRCTWDWICPISFTVMTGWARWARAHRSTSGGASERSSRAGCSRMNTR